MKTLGRYEIHEEIGRGAMGLVYRGIDPKINRSVALKCLRAHLLEGQEDSGKGFQQEMRALGRLTHPNIVAIFDAGKDETSEQGYIVMEYVKGLSLAGVIKDRRVLSIHQIVHIGVQICRGLHFAHSKGVIHRDIKPGNILLSDDLKQVKITDFGIARMDDATLTQTEHLTGTPPYMSPEQCRGETLDGRSDLFAVGALLYELLCKEKAFQGDSVVAIVEQVLHHTPYAPSIISEHVPCVLSGVVMQALEKTPEYRYGSGDEMADELEMAIDETKHFSLTKEPETEGGGATRILPASKKKPSSQKQPVYAVRYALMISLLLMISTGMFFIFRAPPKTDGNKRLAQETEIKALSGVEAKIKKVAKDKLDAEVKSREVAKEEETAKARLEAEATFKKEAKARAEAEARAIKEARAKADAGVKRLNKLAITSGLVQFETTPSGANILINGDWVGISPMSVELAAGQAHELLVTKEGYHALEATINAPAGEKTPLNLTLLEEENP